jgi:hypothetical protein
MRKFIIAIGLLLGIFFIASNFAEVGEIAAILQQGEWRFILLATMLLLIWLVNMAGSYKTIFQVLGLEQTFGRLLILTTAANFINVVAPSGGIGGMAIFIAESRKKGNSGARAMVAGALYVIFDYFGFLLFLGWGLIVLYQRNILNIAEISASLILFSIWVMNCVLLYLGFRSEQALADALTWLAILINRLLKPFIHKDKFTAESARHLAHDAVEGINELRRRPLELIYPFLFSISNKLILLLIFSVLFKAYQVPASIGTLVAGTSIAYLFEIVSLTPYGLGVVEPVLILAFRSMFIPISKAFVITMAYRGVTFWLPLFLGGIAFQWVGAPDEKIVLE